MRIVVVGLNHQSAPVSLREKVSVGPDEMGEALEELKSRVGNGAILSTCNRSEAYTIAPTTHQGVESLKGFFTAYHNVSRRGIEPHLYTYNQRKAVHHLFRVASGLDSLILGEAQILGQVRDAYSAASRHGMVGGTLSRLFHQTLRVGKRARTDTNIGRNAQSVSRAAVDLARRTLGDLGSRRVLVIGIGAAGKLAARALADAGATNILVTNRTYSRAEELARELGGEVAPFHELGQLLGEPDIAISATGAPGYIVTREMVAEARVNNGHPLFLIDIAVPRDIDPHVKELPGVHLFDVDDLEQVAETGRRLREVEAVKVEAIVADEVDRFMDWLSSLEVVPTVAALRERAENIRTRELAWAMKRLPGLGEDGERKLEAFSRAIMKKLMHQPIASLKERGDPIYTQAARQLFGVSDETD